MHALGYNALLISTIVDIDMMMPTIVGYNALLISTIVDLEFVGNDKIQAIMPF